MKVFPQKRQYVFWLKPYRSKIMVLTVLYLISSLIALFFAFYSKDLIDNVLNQQINQFIFYAVLLSLLLIINLVSQAVYKYLLTLYTNQAIKDLKSKYFNHLLRTREHDRKTYHTGTLMTHLESDIELVANGIIGIIPRFVFYTARFIGAFTLLMIIEPLFVFLFAGLGILLFTGSRIIAPSIRKRHAALQKAKDQEQSFTQESLANIDIIKSFSAELKMTQKQQNYQSILNKAKLQKTKLTIFTSSSLNLFFAFGYAFALIYGGYQLQFGLSVGYLIAMIQLVQHLQSPFSGLTLLYPTYQSVLASMSRLQALETMSLEQTTNTSIDTFESLIAENLTFAYNQEKPLFQLSFTIHKNQTILIKGPSGVGKTTLMKLLLGFLPPQHGKLFINTSKKTHDISSLTRSLFSYVPQNNLILSGTIRDNLNLFSTHSDEELYQVLNDVSLAKDIQSHPDQLNMLLSERGQGLSEGQLQRLAIARSLLKDAPILLFDEITSSLDLQTEMKLIQHLKSLHTKTIIMISHHQLDEQLFDQVINI